MSELKRTIDAITSAVSDGNTKQLKELSFEFEECLGLGFEEESLDEQHYLLIEELLFSKKFFQLPVSSQFLIALYYEFDKLESGQKSSFLAKIKDLDLSDASENYRNALADLVSRKYNFDDCISLYKELLEKDCNLQFCRFGLDVLRLVHKDKKSIIEKLKIV